MKKVAVIVGRFQPPTIGHYYVFDQVKRYVLENQNDFDLIPIVVVVSGEKSSQDKKRNPLTADERISFMKGSGLADGIKFMIAKSAYDAFDQVNSQHEIGAVAAGSDRADAYLKMLETEFGLQSDPIKIGRETSKDAIDKDAQLADILKYLDEDLPISMVSGSLARKAASSGDLRKFSIITGLTRNEEIARKLMDKLRRAMEGGNEPR